MVGLNIGVKVATLPVIALGVGIGVDYALYVLSVTLTNLRNGAEPVQCLLPGPAFHRQGGGADRDHPGHCASLTWVLSPIKFQADMGMLLAFMFIWNMVGALVLVPALAHFLLKPGPVSAEATGSR